MGGKGIGSIGFLSKLDTTGAMVGFKCQLELQENTMIDEAAIREQAYGLWERDARPEGAAKFYWHLARQQLEAKARRLSEPDLLVHALPDFDSGEPEDL